MITHIRGLITPLITTHAPPSTPGHGICCLNFEEVLLPGALLVRASFQPGFRHAWCTDKAASAEGGEGGHGASEGSCNILVPMGLCRNHSFQVVLHERFPLALWTCA